MAPVFVLQETLTLQCPFINLAFPPSLCLVSVLNNPTQSETFLWVPSATNVLAGSE